MTVPSPPLPGAPPPASLSVDLDNRWSYEMIHGEPGWDRYASYLDRLVPRLLEVLEATGLRVTCFVVGRDAAEGSHHDVLGAIARAGHEIGNHSFSHRPWLHRMSDTQIADEVTRAEDAIGAATGVHPRGFRGPGYSLSATTLRVLRDRGYAYDASMLPTVIGPLARAWYFRSARLSAAQRAERHRLYGRVRDGFTPLRPYRWDLGDDGPTLLEIPVTTFPGIRVPMHVSYLLALAGRSPRAATAYFAAALGACRVAGVEPSLLLHPLDLLGGDDLTDEERSRLAFFPGTAMPGARKRELVRGFLDRLRRGWRVVTLGEHAAVADRRLLHARPAPTDTPGRDPDAQGARTGADATATGEVHGAVAGPEA